MSPLNNFNGFVKSARVSHEVPFHKLHGIDKEQETTWLITKYEELSKQQELAIEAMRPSIELIVELVSGDQTHKPRTTVDLLKKIAWPYMKLIWNYTREHYYCSDCLIHRYFAGNFSLYKVFFQFAETHEPGFPLLENTKVMNDGSHFYIDHKDGPMTEEQFHAKYTTCTQCHVIDRCLLCQHVKVEDYQEKAMTMPMYDGTENYWKYTNKG